MSDEAIFTAYGDRYVPSAHARGPWNPDEMHGGAPAALAARALQALETKVPMRCVRIAFEFAGAVPLRPLTVSAVLTRPGRRLALAEVAVRADDVDVLRGRATLLRVGAVALPDPAADGAEAIPGPDDGVEQHWTGGDEREGFHLTAIELRFARGDWGRGPALGWFRLRRPLVAGEEPTPLQRAVAFSDFGNGLSRVLDFRTHLFVNTDLTVHLHREPATEWIALDARTDLDATGAGQATSILRDERGRIGVAAQSLFVDER